MFKAVPVACGIIGRAGKVIWIFGIIALVVVISLISTSSSSGNQIAAAQASAEWESRMASRVAAYKDYIRREGDESWKKLSDNELEDMIANAMRGLARDITDARSLVKMAFWVTGAVVVITAFFLLPKIEYIRKIMQDIGFPIFFIVLIVAVFGTGFVASRIVSAWREKAIERKWSRGGWDVSKLIV